MKKLLITVDGLNAATTGNAVAEAVGLWREEPVAVHLLSVQPAVSGHVAMFFGPGELQRLHEDAGLEEMAPARALLEQAGVQFTSSVRIGRRAETVATVARELGCDVIVMGQDAGPSLADRVLGSAAQQVRQILSPADYRVIGS
jgi:nucleotide-binding universal stress UspA family protein